MTLSLKRFGMNLVVLILIVCCAPQGVFSLEKDAYFAGGCFWCLEHDFEEMKGVISAQSGYAGGTLLEPTYRNHEGHQESVRVKYNPDVITYEDLLRGFWRNVDPSDDGGQFCDRGDSYRPVIFPSDDQQYESAQLSIKRASSELDIPKKDLKVRINRLNKFLFALTL